MCLRDFWQQRLSGNRSCNTVIRAVTNTSRSIKVNGSALIADRGGQARGQQEHRQRRVIGRQGISRRQRR